MKSNSTHKKAVARIRAVLISATFSISPLPRPYIMYDVDRVSRKYLM